MKQNKIVFSIHILNIFLDKKPKKTNKKSFFSDFFIGKGSFQLNEFTTIGPENDPGVF